MQPQSITVRILRPPAPSGAKIGTPIDTGRVARILVEAHTRLDPIAVEQDGRMYYNLSAHTIDGRVPDIREQDRLRDDADVDPRTGAAALYIVRGVLRFLPSHLELFVQRQIGA